HCMKQGILGLAFLLFGSVLSAQVSVGIRMGAPPQPRVVLVQPRNPGPGYVFVDGYWYPQGNHYAWHNGYWTRPPYAGAQWRAPRYEQQQYFSGNWYGDQGERNHDHKYDRDRDRDNHGNRSNKGKR
ncbi:MAG: YXWGXW repeat-containing protein, partial [Acidobacteriota bacterium]